MLVRTCYIREGLTVNVLYNYVAVNTISKEAIEVRDLYDSC